MIEDIYGTKLDINFSRSGYYRIDFKNHDWPEYKHAKTGEVLPYCISMTKKQAKALVAHLEMMFEKEGEE
jgi:hypothetical protein